jgi:hypothetical protein
MEFELVITPFLILFDLIRVQNTSYLHIVILYLFYFILYFTALQVLIDFGLSKHYDREDRLTHRGMLRS